MHLSQEIKRIETGAVVVLPENLYRIAAHQLEPGDLKTGFIQLGGGPFVHLAQNINFAGAGSAGAGSA